MEHTYDYPSDTYSIPNLYSRCLAAFIRMSIISSERLNLIGKISTSSLTVKCDNFHDFIYVMYGHSNILLEFLFRREKS